MIPGSLSFVSARERDRSLRGKADAARSLDTGATPATGLTLRQANAADSPRLRQLAAVAAVPPPSGPVLLAVVDGRLRAALPLNGGTPIADPRHCGKELIELLRIRAAQLA